MLMPDSNDKIPQNQENDVLFYPKENKQHSMSAL
jgi:hypothetical protein